jgi:hypothetical protein
MGDGWTGSSSGVGVLAVVGCLSVPPASPEGGTDSDTTASTGAGPSSGPGSSEPTSSADATGEVSTTATATTGSADVSGLVLSAPGGTELPAGATIEITATITPPQAATAGLTYAITTDVGLLRGPSGDAARIDVTTPPATAVTLGSDAPETSGDDVFTVVDPRLRAVQDDGDTYGVAEGFALESLLASPTDRSELVDRRSLIALPPPTSAFPRTLHIASAGTPPELYRLEDDALVYVSAPEVQPDEGVSQIAFSDPAGPHGDHLFVCSASAGSGDGVFVVDFAGGWSDWFVFNNCNGLAIDTGEIIEPTPFADPVYLDVSSSILQRVDPSMDTENLITDLPVGASGFKLFINDRGPFEVGLYLVFPGVDPPGTDGAILRAAVAAAGWSTEAVLSGLRGPRTATFTAGSDFGGLMYVYLELDGELRGYRPDLSSFTLVDGLRGFADLVLDPDANALWIVESGRGKILRLTWM